MLHDEFRDIQRSIREACMKMVSAALGRPVGLYESTADEGPDEVFITQESWELFESFCQLMRHDPQRAAACDQDHRQRATILDGSGELRCLTCHAGIHNFRYATQVGATKLVLIGGEYRLEDDAALLAEAEQNFHRLAERFHLSAEQVQALREKWAAVPRISRSELQRQFGQVRDILHFYGQIKTQLDRYLDVIRWQQHRIAHEFATLAEPMRHDVQDLLGHVENADKLDKTYLRQILLEQDDSLVRLLDSVHVNLPGYFDLKFVPRLENMERLIRRCAMAYRSQAKYRHINLRLTLEKEPEAQIHVSPMHLEAALRNVVDNAVKYSFRGTEQRPREIVVQGRLLRGGYEIMVENYGVGIDEDELESIFEPGYQSRHKAKERVTGFGMGLAIVRQYVQMHGGRVWATSSPQTDSATITVTTPYLTRLWIRLPKRPPATPNPPEEKSR